MIHEITFNDMKKLNNFIVNNSITKSNIISISLGYDRGNPSWGKWYILFYFVPSILGDDE